MEWLYAERQTDREGERERGGGRNEKWSRQANLVSLSACTESCLFSFSCFSACNVNQLSFLLENIQLVMRMILIWKMPSLHDFCKTENTRKHLTTIKEGQKKTLKEARIASSSYWHAPFLLSFVFSRAVINTQKESKLLVHFGKEGWRCRGCKCAIASPHLVAMTTMYIRAVELCDGDGWNLA